MTLDADDFRRNVWLVQRIRRRDMSSAKGIDALFTFDYMGSAEFEFGTLPQALKAMRAAKTERWRPEEITSGKFRAYYLGASDMIDMAAELFQDQLKPIEKRHRLKELSYIRESYVDGELKAMQPFDGWWALDPVPSFVLFRQKDHAEAWLGAL